ncbi:indolepyruvate ferredoxin oxidoreductase subunit alpha [Methanocalculus sp.]|uniref:indolepyruvate ferredoxin oxidoreductase subunit alpha n=1 Tax=Methanocalculus sp. TaxID=2004547 RepID=UPI0027165D6F|nr:indolepyruvate ferredoxin oxidoreductase subunit alpha [Methanocalculus sp.]MDO8841120.1 indolepyruvate ferredoxin oxidoreductase subunit alpha [Methanocalculus sp.]
MNNKKYLLGNVAIAHACREAGVDFVSGYPGTPSSEVIETLRADPDTIPHLEWSVNEKVAYENALAAAWCGCRALVTMKHVGVNVAADPLMTSGYTGVTGGFVLLAADDPFAHSSQNEQDSRIYASFAKIPCIDPSGIQDAHDGMKLAFELSEEFGLPVMVRPTTRICHSKGDIELGDPATEHRVGTFIKNPKQYVVIPAHTRVLHKLLNEKQPVIKKRLIECGFNTQTIRGTKAVIAGGISAEYAREVVPDDISIATIGAYPIDEEWLAEFVSRHTEILVIEEMIPVIEGAVREVACDQKIYGKKNGYLPHEGEYSPSVLAGALLRCGFINANPYQAVEPALNLPVRPPILCAGCMHRSTFYAMKKVFKDGIFPSDIGCYTLGLQLGAVDTTICMGASITVASGINLCGEERDVVCTIGDSTFLHTGVNGLINAVYNGANMVVVILDNRITAMTGHQPNPNTGITACGVQSPSLSLETLCRACGVSCVETVDPYDLTLLLETMRKVKEEKGVRVIIARQPCIIVAKRAGMKRRRFMVDPDICTGCQLCIKYGCPAIEFHDEKASINDLCTGCAVCADICPAAAIRGEVKR